MACWTASASALCSLTGAGSVLEANGSALDILRRGDGLRVRDGALDSLAAGRPQPPAEAWWRARCRTFGVRRRGVAR